MSEPADTLSKREFLEMTCLIFKEILNPRLLRSAMEAAAKKLGIPDAPSIVSKILASEKVAGTKVKTGRGKDGGDKKDKEKRGTSAYNVMVAWVCDLAAHYGKHPDILRVKNENPGIKMGPSFTAKFFELYPARKEPFAEICKNFLQQHNGGKAEADGAGAVSTLDAFKRYTQAHPEANPYTVLGIELDPSHKTDPAQMRAEAAEARRHAEGTAWGSTTPAVKQLDFGGTTANGGAPGTSAPGTAAAADAPAGGAKSTEKGKRKAEVEAAAPPAAAPANGDAGAGTAKKKHKAEEGEAKPDKEKKQKKKAKAEAEPAEEKPAADAMDVDAAPKTADKKTDKKEKKEKKEKAEKQEQKEAGEKQEQKEKAEKKEQKEKGEQSEKKEKKSEKKEKKKKEKAAQDA